MLPQNDFPDGILDQTAHRPYPLPDGPWIMTQSWHDLLFAHWPIGERELRERVPPGLELDLFDGQAWVSITPFHMTNVAPRGVPAVPWVSAFPELNVRTYVRHAGRPGIYFFSLDAGNPLAVGAARSLFHLPYFTARMSVESRDGRVHYRSERSSSDDDAATFAGSYGPVGPVFEAEPGTLDSFLTERYCLYTFDDRWQLYRGEIHHPAWPLQRAEAQIEVNTMAESAGLRLPSLAPQLHFSRRQDVLVWALVRV
jgi:uncharacterized protein